jgi:hypothetical protein
VCSNPELPGYRTLPAVRQLLTMPDKLRAVAFESMTRTDAFGGLCNAAAQIGLSDSKKNREYVSGAVDHSEWLDSPAMASVLTGADFDLTELKTGKATVYLVLPPHYLGEHGRFLRLFVRAALDAMAKSLKGERCLFLLDEFFALGRIDEIAKSAGLMPGYGVQLWPFVQDLGQLVTLYGKDGAHTFFGNSDAHIFFGNADVPTLDYISASVGRINAADIGATPPTQNLPRDDFWSEAERRQDQERKAILHQNKRGQYEHAMRAKGDPRLTAQEVRELLAKRDGDLVARTMIVFAKGGDVLNLRLAPYFAAKPAPLARPPRVEVPDTKSATLPYSFTLKLTGSVVLGWYAILMLLAPSAASVEKEIITSALCAGVAAYALIERYRKKRNEPEPV